MDKLSEEPSSYPSELISILCTDTYQKRRASQDKEGREKSVPRFCHLRNSSYLCTAFDREVKANMVVVAQLVRALDCGSRCRGFESHLPPKEAG